jgi:hypothetical protein
VHSIEFHTEGQELRLAHRHDIRASKRAKAQASNPPLRSAFSRAARGFAAGAPVQPQRVAVGSRQPVCGLWWCVCVWGGGYRLGLGPSG